MARLVHLILDMTRKGNLALKRDNLIVCITWTARAVGPLPLLNCLQSI